MGVDGRWVFWCFVKVSPENVDLGNAQGNGEIIGSSVLLIFEG